MDDHFWKDEESKTCKFPLLLLMGLGIGLGGAII